MQWTFSNCAPRHTVGQRAALHSKHTATNQLINIRPRLSGQKTTSASPHDSHPRLKESSTGLHRPIYALPFFCSFIAAIRALRSSRLRAISFSFSSLLSAERLGCGVAGLLSSDTGGEGAAGGGAGADGAAFGFVALTAFGAGRGSALGFGGET